MKPERNHPARRRGAIPTLRDVAQCAGVSPSTVSATLNEAPRARYYSTETKERIRQAAKDLGYVANPLAKTLKRSRSGLLGIVAFSQYGIYYGRLLEAAQEHAEQLGYEIVAADMHYDPGRLEKCVNLLLAWTVEGILLLTGGQEITPAALQRLAHTDIPVLGGGARSGNLPFTCIAFNNMEAGGLLAKHLLDFGHTRIGVLAANPNNQQCEERIAGIAAALAERNMVLDEQRIIRVVGVDVGVAAGYHCAAALLERDPKVTAVICQNDVMAIGALCRLREEGRRVPEDVSVTGFDDLYLESQAEDNDRLGAYLSPALTTIRAPIRQMGKEAVALLVNMVQSPVEGKAKKIVEFSPELIVRDSTGPAPDRKAAYG